MPNRSVVNGVAVNGDTVSYTPVEFSGVVVEFEQSVSFEATPLIAEFEQQVNATFAGVVAEFEQTVESIPAGENIVLFEQSVGVTFDGTVVEILQNVQLKSTSGGSGVVAVEFSQQVTRTFSGDVGLIAQMVVDDG